MANFSSNFNRVVLFLNNLRKGGKADAVMPHLFGFVGKVFRRKYIILGGVFQLKATFDKGVSRGYFGFKET